MARKKKLKFSPYCKPFAPYKPKEMMDKYEKIGQLQLNQYCHTEIQPDMIPAGATHMCVDVEFDSYEDNGISSMCMVFYKKLTVPDPQYKMKLKYYEEQYAAYKTEIAVWKEEKKVYDKEQEKKDFEYKKQLLKKLQKEIKQKEALQKKLEEEVGITDDDT